MKHIKRFNENENIEDQEMKFDSKSLIDKDSKPGFKTEPVDNDEKEFKKLLDDKIEKFESFIKK